MSNKFCYFAFRKESHVGSCDKKSELNKLFL
nr:MAG TPA_asm: hypothetical protein [Caudoviricetes sp.]